MTKLRNARTALAIVLVLILAGGVLLRGVGHGNRIDVVGYFDNSTALFPGDDVRILGVPVGKVTAVEPHPDGVKIAFWFDRKYKVPADALAAILSPMLVTGRAIALTPVYTGGPTMRDGAVIPAAAPRFRWSGMRCGCS